MKVQKIRQRHGPRCRPRRLWEAIARSFLEDPRPPRLVDVLGYLTNNSDPRLDGEALDSPPNQLRSEWKLLNTKTRKRPPRGVGDVGSAAALSPHPLAGAGRKLGHCTGC